jgi:selenocysteine-specific elongation factor
MFRRAHAKDVYGLYTVSRMKSVIVGTAGHIDHGKTALVKALTGIDADRLEEEKRRGITIDIGFAHLELPSPVGDTLRLGFVDVPGHERFVRNMLAGVGGIDVVLLVVAADEGIKPQTREHFDICWLLHVRRGLTVITKSDLVDRDTLDVVRLELEDFLRGSFLDGAPIVPVSSRTGEGIDELKQELARVALDAPAKDSTALFRLPVDRVFVMKGFGTVVTGTLVSGSVRPGDEVEIFPMRRRARARGVQVHGYTADRAVAGERTALNLAGVTHEELHRGVTLASPAALRPTQRADVLFNLLPSARALRDRANVHFHTYTSETIAQVVLYRGAQVVPGGTAYAQLRFADPLLLLPEDRFILRQFSPVITVGGGVVLDAQPMLRPRKDEVLAFLAALADASRDRALLARIVRRGHAGLTISQAVAETGWRANEVEDIAVELARRGEIVRAGETLLSREAFLETRAATETSVQTFHRTNPLMEGIGREELRDRLLLSPEVFTTALDALVGEGKLALAGDQIKVAGRSVVMKDEEAEARKMIEIAFAQAGLKVPALKEVLAGLPVEKARAQKIVTLLLRERVLIKLGDDLVFHRNALDDLRRSVTEYKARSPRIDVGKFKDLAGVSRKYAIPLLEYLDRERVTRRVGDERVIL